MSQKRENIFLIFSSLTKNIYIKAISHFPKGKVLPRHTSITRLIHSFNPLHPATLQKILQTFIESLYSNGPTTCPNK
jgi:hypothetical protein